MMVNLKKYFLVGFLLSMAVSIFAQFSMDDLKKYSDEKKKKSKPSFIDKLQVLEDAAKKNEKSQLEFTGGLRYGVAKTLKELENEVNPETKKYLLVADKIDQQYSVFNENQEYAIYRLNSLPPSGEIIQFALKKELQKEVQKKYKKGTMLEGGNYEIIGTQSFLELVLDEKPISVIKFVYVKLF